MNDASSPSLPERVRWKFRRLILPRPPARPGIHPAGAPIVVAGLFSTASGIGESARICARALRSEGIDIIEIDLSARFGQVDFAAPDASAGALPATRHGTLILHVNAPETEAALMHLKAYRAPGWRIVGYWAWETSVLPETWRRPADYLSEIWTPSEFVQDVIGSSVNRPVRKVPHNVVSPTTPRPRKHEHATSLSACIMADGRSSFERKNVLGSIEMFRQAFPGRKDVRLDLRLRNLSEFPGFARQIETLVREDGRIVPLHENEDVPGRWECLSACDVILSAHRAEGFGLHLAEAMSIGTVVVATGWSGNLEFTCSQSAFLLDYDLKQVSDPFGIYDGEHRAVWAAPKLRDGIDALRALAEDRTLLQRRSRASRQLLSQRLGSQVYREALGISEAQRPSLSSNHNASSN